MILIRRIAAIASIFIIGGLFEILIWKTNWYREIIVLLGLVVIFILLWLARKKLEIKEAYPLLITPLLFIGFGFIFIFFIEGSGLKQLSILAIVFLWGVFIENVFRFLYQSVRYQPYSLENITAYLNLTTVFLMGASFNSLILFLGYSDLMLLILAFLVTLLLVLQTIAINKISIRDNLLPIIVLTLLTTEMFWITKFLPSSYLVNGLIIAVTFYFSMGIVRHWFLESLDKSVIKRYLWISLLALLVVTITARWT